ncbi:MAG: DUF370 domain-containing protein [Peptococcaceae bacterium]|nr:DUF370 domain-containing protein [Peptococcaceae bacterium]MBO5115180.1 DUF370 domain-containing protein [Peptococcaceae bacterium]MBO5140657.1 DUF370 domain-containing protein [Peptococcaceae bacterium]MBO5302206.1 DUF370 domain-containing protein [Peptococcaceae bacterium]MBO5365956.1 DUF370 domain-containing protein [Peptococcaceae bacterium]
MGQFMNVGFDNMVQVDEIIAIVSPESAPVKRMVQTAKDAGVVIDVTHGRKTRSVIFTDSDYIILSAIQPETLTGRLDAE